MALKKLYVEDRKGNAYIDNVTTCHFVYAHGSLEEKAGYDIVLHDRNDNFDYKTDHVDDVIAVLSDGTEIESRLFFWHYPPCNYYKGLLIQIGDDAAMAYAEKVFNSKEEFI